jgi:hypothetical protein
VQLRVEAEIVLGAGPAESGDRFLLMDFEFIAIAFKRMRTPAACSFSSPSMKRLNDPGLRVTASKVSFVTP